MIKPCCQSKIGWWALGVLGLISLFAATNANAVALGRRYQYYPFTYPDICTTDAAYAAGVYDARYNRPPMEFYSQLCDIPPGPKNALNQAYMNGYNLGQRPEFNKRYECLNSIRGQVCGYDCKRNAYGEVGCAPFPTQSCLIDKFTNKVICGYHCLREKFGSVKCGKTYLDNCLKDDYGRVTCGQNCRKSYGSVKCNQSNGNY